MRNDKRRARRRPIKYSAWMALDSDNLHGCVLADISDTGARLDVDDSKIVPEHFMLLLSGTGSARRSCRVVWREPGQVGVAFERRLSETAATLVPKTVAAAPAPAPAAEEEKTTIVKV
ncbi:MAG TPA: PilZ domain-containing protein [Pseudolabrys sp.]|nr:PilZ domain-containing protein [Pseudolabrys sp.]